MLSFFPPVTSLLLCRVISSFYNSDHSAIDSKENTGSFWNFFGSKKSTPADEVLKKVRIDAPLDDGTFDDAATEDSSTFDDAAKKDSDDKMYDLEVRLALNKLKDPPAGIKTPGKKKKEVIPPTPTRKSTRNRTPAKRDNRATFG